MKEVTIQELVEDLQGQIVEVESADIYGVNVNFSKARVEYDEEWNELSFVAGWYDSEWGLGGVSYRVDDVVESITLNDDGSYTIQFNQYMADIMISITRRIRRIK